MCDGAGLCLRLQRIFAQLLQPQHEFVPRQDGFGRIALPHPVIDLLAADGCDVGAEAFVLLIHGQVQPVQQLLIGLAQARIGFALPV